MPDEELLARPRRPVQGVRRHDAHQDAVRAHSQELCVADLAELIGATQKRRLAPAAHAQAGPIRLVKFQRDGKNVIYSLSDDHVYTMLAQGMTPYRE